MPKAISDYTFACTARGVSLPRRISPWLLSDALTLYPRLEYISLQPASLESSSCLYTKLADTYSGRPIPFLRLPKGGGEVEPGPAPHGIETDHAMLAQLCLVDVIPLCT